MRGDLVVVAGLMPPLAEVALGRDIPRRDRVDSYPIGSERRDQGTDQPDQPGLRGRVGGQSVRHHRVGRGGERDRSVAVERPHVRQRGLEGHECADQVQLDRRPESLDRKFGDVGARLLRGQRAACHRDDVPDRSNPAECLSDGGRIRKVRDPALESVALRGRLDIEPEHREARLQKRIDGGRADSPGSPRDDDAIRHSATPSSPEPLSARRVPSRRVMRSAGGRYLSPAVRAAPSRPSPPRRCWRS